MRNAFPIQAPARSSVTGVCRVAPTLRSGARGGTQEKMRTPARGAAARRTKLPPERWVMWVLLLAALTASLAACGSKSVRSPFQVEAGSEAGAGGAPGSDGGLDVGEDPGYPTLGGPCADDSQCEDDIACTADHCDDSLQRCRHVPDDALCRDTLYCNGEEVCDPRLGCRGGPPVSCTDLDSCTIDTCVEKTKSCARTPRDADGDGDPVWNCAGGGDCDDTDPTVSSAASEICGNEKDDDCDGQVDEVQCTTPLYDNCSNSLAVSASGSVMLSLAAALLDYPNRCAPANPKLADVVLNLKVPPGPARDIDVVAQSDASDVSLATATTCGEVGGELCSQSLPVGTGSLSRLHLYGLAPGVHALYVTSGAQAHVALAVTYSDASVPPNNETCQQALPLDSKTPTRVSLVGPSADLSSACNSQTGELVYSFVLAEASDVRVFASPLDAFGVPQISLRDARCTPTSAELTCASGHPNAAIFARALPPGRYYVSVAASAPSDVELQLEVTAPSNAPLDEGCRSSPELEPNQTIDVSLADHTDAVNLGCLAGAPDASYALTLSESSDVLIVERIAQGDTGAVSLAEPACTKATRLACATSGASPVRTTKSSLPPGSYRVVAESAAGNPVSVTAFTRRALPEALVALADDCIAPFQISDAGGRFRGNTANAHADFSAGCDVPNQAKFGAPDQLLHLDLKKKSRVVLDMSGSAYETMLSVRRGPSCPGMELPLACAAGYGAARSFLDLELDDGDYYVQVDGYGGDSGAWVLDVYVIPEAN